MKYRNLTLKYALVNAGYMLVLCASSGYVYNYLSQSGFSDSLAGTVIALISALGILIQPWAGSLADRSEKVTEKGFVSALMIITAVPAMLTAFVPEGQALIIPLIVISFTAVGVTVPLLNSMAFSYERDHQTINFGLCRGIGSAAFAVGSKLTGTLWTHFGRGSYPIYITAAALFTLLMVRLMPEGSGSYKAEGNNDSAGNVSYAEFFRRNRQTAVIFSALVMIYFMHMLCNTYIAKILGQFVDASRAETVQGTALLIAGMCELPVMLGFSFLMKRFSVVTIMKASAVCFTLKHLLIYLSAGVPVFYAAMALQMFSYAALVPAVVYYGGRYIAEQDRNKGQAVLAMAVTVSTLLAGFAGGRMFDIMSVKSVFLTGLLVSAAGTLVMVLFAEDPEKEAGSNV